MSTININYEEYLLRVYGYDNFRECQKEIISSLIEEKRDVCCVMATGHGKSICYQLPAIITNKCSIVISPLLSLMEDQKINLENLGISVCCYNSNLINKNIINLKILKGDYTVIYITPETIKTSYNMLIRLNKKIGISLFAIDESHCVSLWGHSFRNSYLELDCIKDFFPDIPIITLTGSATDKVQDDIIHHLKLKNPLKIKTSMNRQNLSYYVHDKTTILKDLKHYSKDESMIIYCQKRKDTEKICKILKNENFNCEYYHAGLNTCEKNEIHINFINDDIKCIIATLAFGMGIDKPNIRKIIHYGCPKDIESYVQETGRSGRDGDLSECHIYFSMKDFSTNQFFINQIQNEELKEHKECIKQKMEKYLYLRTCRRKYMLNYFNEEYNNNNLDYICCDNCNNGLDNEVQNEDVTKELKYFIGLINSLNVKYGKIMLIDILRGSRNKKITNKLMENKYYGVGNYKSNDWWRYFVQHLNNEGVIKTNSSRIYINDPFYTSNDNFCFEMPMIKSIQSSKKLIKTSKNKIRGVKNENELSDTQNITYNMFKEGKSLNQISDERNLTYNTIFQHLTKLVELGIGIDLKRLKFTKDKYLELKPYIINYNDLSLKNIKENLENLNIEISYNEIKLSIELNKITNIDLFF